MPCFGPAGVSSKVDFLENSSRSVRHQPPLILVAPVLHVLHCRVEPTCTVHLESRCRLKFYFQRYWAEITSTCSWDQAEQESIVVLPVLCSWVESGGAEMIPLWSWFCRKECEVTRKTVLPARFLMWKQVWSIKKQGRLVKKNKLTSCFLFCVASCIFL